MLRFLAKAFPEVRRERYECKSGRVIRKAFIGVIVSILWTSICYAESPSEANLGKPLELQVRRLSDVLGTIELTVNRTLRNQYYVSEYKIDGTHNEDSSQLYTGTIEFSNGSAFYFSDNSLVDGIIYVIAKSIKIDGKAVLKWSRHEENIQFPPGRGKSLAGPPGRVDGEDGKDGAPGQPGSPGYTGRSAPSIIIIVGDISGGVLIVDLRGEDGGKGGAGGIGGDGGPGAIGSPASQSVFDCKAGGGTGGKGGSGGRGGDGGSGGKGGNGGDFFLLSVDELAKNHLQVFGTRGSGGIGGDPGDGGEPGQGGRGGQEAKPFCGGGATGPNGSHGDTGVPGPKGAYGLDSRYNGAVIPQDMLQKIFAGTN